MDIRLIVTAGKATKRELPLTLPATIGRSRDADLTIGHPMVSRRHCELNESQGRVRIHDSGSLNGTVLGGQRVTEALLQPHDEFTIGPLTFRIEYTPTGQVEPASQRPAVEPSVPLTGRGEEASREAVPETSDLEETLSVPEDASPQTADEETADRASEPPPEGGIAPPDGRLPDFGAPRGPSEPPQEPPAHSADEPTRNEEEPGTREDSALRRFLRGRS